MVNLCLCVKKAIGMSFHARPASKRTMTIEGHVQEWVSVAVFVHQTGFQSGAMNKIALSGLFMYMPL